MAASTGISEGMKAYFNSLERDLEVCMEIAKKARAKGLDPSLDVEIPVAEDLASRVEKLVGPVGVAEIIREESKGKNREEVSLLVARKIALEYKGEKAKALDQAIRTGLAILTEGVLVAPLEGIADVRIGKNSDGTEYADVYFAGPIRSAGGTGQALSVLIADMVKSALGLSRYNPTEKEVERYKEEFGMYKSLQYQPTNDEVELVVRSCPVCINGEGTEKEEVSGNRDLPRVETNQVRGGVCLVIAEGLCLKAAKVNKHVKKLDIKGWDFIDRFLKKEKKEDGAKKAEAVEKKDCLQGYCAPPPGATEPKLKYIEEILAGRPVFGHPSVPGNFRLRLGRGRNTGLAAIAINPAAMYIVDEFIAVGTQVKIERPGKAGALGPCDSIEGPLVQLADGTVTQINDVKTAKALHPQVKEIIDLGEVLIPFGEFSENNHTLIPGSYSKEWWWLEYLGAGGKDLKDYYPDPYRAFELARDLKIPLCPDYNLYWHDLSPLDIDTLAVHISAKGRYTRDLGVDDSVPPPKDIKAIPVTRELSFPIRRYNQELSFPADPKIKEILKVLGVEHAVRGQDFVVTRYAYPLLVCLGLGEDLKRQRTSSEYGLEMERDRRALTPKERFQVLKVVEHLAGIALRARSPTRIGSRMGRPEKANLRKMKPPVHALFPIAQSGSAQRLLRKAADYPTVEVDIGARWCPACGTKRHLISCEKCGTHTLETQPGTEPDIVEWKMPVGELMEAAQKRLKIDQIPEVKAVQGLISKNKTAEPLEKGMLRAKNDVFVFKDGTSRFDLTDLTLTHFRPKEIGLNVGGARGLGYTKDIYGKELTRDDQILELRPQDVVVSSACGDYFVHVANFLDELLVRFYGLDPFYNAKKKEDLIGHLTIALAPHTSGGVLSRVIGYVTAAVGYGHPYFHCAKRRNCLAGSTKVVLSEGETRSLRSLFQETAGDCRIVDSFGTQARHPKDLKVLTIDPKTGETKNENVISVLRTPSPKHLLRIKTNGGRELMASPYHPLLIDFGEKLVKKKALEAKVGDALVSIKELPLPVHDISRIDLLIEFENKKVSDVMINGISELIDGIIKSNGGLRCISKKLNIPYKSLSNYIYRDSIPIEIAKKVVAISGLKLDGLPEDVHLSVKRDTVKLPRFIPVDERFCRMIGYYLAEGYSRKQQGMCYQVSMSNEEPDIHNDMVKCIEHTLCIKPNVSKNVITISSRLVYSLFTEVLSVGINAKTKQIPPILRNLPLIKAGNILSSYMAGDGSVEKDRLTVKITSASLPFIKDIDRQFRRFGIYGKLRHETRTGGGVVKQFYEKKKLGLVPKFESHSLVIRSSYARKLYEEIGISSIRKSNALKSVLEKERSSRHKELLGHPEEKITEITSIPSIDDFVYDIEVKNSHSFLTDELLLTSNCDGDEDALMLLLDGLLNFSRSFIPEKRGGLMDAPLVLSSRIDPNEIDKEAQNIDCLPQYPLEYYNATMAYKAAKDVEKFMDTVGGRIGKPSQYEGIMFTHDTADISEGPKASAYKTLGSMEEKMNAQLDLGRKIRAVDESDEAAKVIETHFLPDMVGNLKSFSRQELRCTKCSTKYRRVPLTGKCIKMVPGPSGERLCDNNLTMTVSEGSVKKYLEVTKKIAVKYHVSPYVYQRVLMTEIAINSLFTQNQVKKMKLDDFL